MNSVQNTLPRDFKEATGDSLITHCSQVGEVYPNGNKHYQFLPIEASSVLPQLTIRNYFSETNANSN
jgi:hypothetical protein